MKKIFPVLMTIVCLIMTAPGPAEQANGETAKDTTPVTAEANRAWFDRLDFDDESETENALRGLIESPESLIIYDDKGNVVWNDLIKNTN